MTTPKWAVAVLACPRCGRGLEGFSVKARLVRCTDCGPYPVLAGVPVLVPEPARWCATFYDAALSALAEVERSSKHVVDTLRAFADAGAGAEPARFSDDWTSAEGGAGHDAPLCEGPGADALAELLVVAKAQSPSLWLEHRAPEGVVVEVGCGAGLTASHLSSKRRALVVGDLSLRAVLHAATRSRAVPVVLDAQALPFKPRSLDGLVAENVVDLLDDPEAFFTSAKLALKAKSALLVSSPGPALGSPDGDDETLVRLAERCGFEVSESTDGLPWLRRNSRRFLEVWLVQTLALRHASSTATRRLRRVS